MHIFGRRLLAAENQQHKAEYEHRQVDELEPDVLLAQHCHTIQKLHQHSAAAYHRYYRNHGVVAR